jgi:glucose-6-phosphate 1-epimerase
MTILDELNARFAIPGHAHFEEAPVAGSLRLQLSSPDSDATLYLQGAHLTHWAPRGGDPVLFLSPKAVFAPGKPIRGGVPVLFPWFGPRWDGPAYDGAHGTRSPAHGFARTSAWTVEAVTREADGTVRAVLGLGPDAVSRSLGFDRFHARLECRIGRTLYVGLQVTNLGEAPMTYEDGLHTYFAVADLEPVRLEGLHGATYRDQRDGGRRKVDDETRFAFRRDVDRTYVDTPASVVIHDPAGRRRIHLDKQGSRTTVVWNPAPLLTPGFADLDEDSWRKFVCVETVNADANRLQLAPGASHTTGMSVRVEPA